MMKQQALLKFSSILLLSLLTYRAVAKLTRDEFNFLNEKTHLSCRRQLDFFYITLNFSNTDTQFTEDIDSRIQSKISGKHWENGTNCNRKVTTQTFKIECKMKFSIGNVLDLPKSYKLRVVIKKQNVMKPYVIKHKNEWPRSLHYELDLLKCFKYHGPVHFEAVGRAETKMNVSWSMNRYDWLSVMIPASSLNVQKKKGISMPSFPLATNNRCNEMKCMYEITGLSPCSIYRICLDLKFTHNELNNRRCIDTKTVCIEDPKSATKCVMVVIITVSALLLVLLVILIAFLVKRRVCGKKNVFSSEHTLLHEYSVGPRSEYQDYSYPANEHAYAPTTINQQ